MNTNMMEMNMNEMEMINGGGDVWKGITGGLFAGATGGATVGGIALGFPGATFGLLLGALGGGSVGGVVAAVTD